MIIVFCGIPGSGKTTTAEILAHRLADLGTVQLVSSDDLRGSVYRNLLKSISDPARKADFLILDATFVRREWRQQVKARAGGEEVVIVYLECPLDVALKRNEARRPNLSARVVHIMSHRLEPPERPTIRIDSVMTSPADAAAKVFDLVRCAQKR